MEKNIEVRVQNKEERFTAETQRRGGKITPHLNPLPQGERRKGLCKLILVLGLALMTTACDKKPVDPTVTISFSGPTPGSNSVYMARNSSLSNGSVLGIDIKVDSVSNLFGAAFDVDFDSTKMTYSGYSAGSFLETGGNSVTYIATQTVNKLIVGVSKQAPSGGQSGSGTLVTLKFNVTGGTSASFSNNILKDSSGNDIPATWSSGGSVTLQ